MMEVQLKDLEQTLETAESNYNNNPLDADNLTVWGTALIETAQFQNGHGCIKMIKDGISKLEEALKIDPKKHFAHWSLGNAFTSQAFLSPDIDAADVMFKQASVCYLKAVDEDPTNGHYLKSLEMSAKAPELYLEIHGQGFNQPTAGGSYSAPNIKGSKKKKESDLKYDILGWVVLAVGIVVWLGMAKSQAPAQFPR